MALAGSVSAGNTWLAVNSDAAVSPLPRAARRDDGDCDEGDGEEDEEDEQTVIAALLLCELAGHLRPALTQQLEETMVMTAQKLLSLGSRFSYPHPDSASSGISSEARNSRGAEN